ncbi:MAG: carboxypeptidase regulatory-like domain-containing protein [Alcanivoracaceae bacterium]|nr:carboxypeptidase regulatory-like domain-containing protein [Alcanivoracaceae bacterium]
MRALSKSHRRSFAGKILTSASVALLASLPVVASAALPAWTYQASSTDPDVIDASGSPTLNQYNTVPIGLNNAGQVLSVSLQNPEDPLAQRLWLYDFTTASFVIDGQVGPVPGYPEPEGSYLMSDFVLSSDDFLMIQGTSPTDAVYARCAISDAAANPSVVPACDALGGFGTSATSQFRQAALNNQGWGMHWEGTSSLQVTALTMVAPDGSSTALDISDLQGADFDHRAPKISNGMQPLVALPYSETLPDTSVIYVVRLFSFDGASWSYQDVTINDRWQVAGLSDDKMLLEAANDGQAPSGLYICEPGIAGDCSSPTQAVAVPAGSDAVAAWRGLTATNILLYTTLEFVGTNAELQSLILRDLETSTEIDVAALLATVPGIGAATPQWAMLSPNGEQLAIIDSSGALHYFSTGAAGAVNTLTLSADDNPVDAYLDSDVTVSLTLDSSTVHGLELTCRSDDGLLSMTDSRLLAFPPEYSPLTIGPDVVADEWLATMVVSGSTDPVTGTHLIAELDFAVPNTTATTTVSCDALASNGFGSQEPIDVVNATINLDNGINGGSGSVSGTVVDANGNPVSGAEVRIFLDGRYLTVLTDQDGNFSFSNLRDGDFDLTVASAEQVADCSAASVSAGQAVTVTDITLYPGDINADGVIDIGDFSLLAAANRSVAGDARYDASADLNDDGRIDVLDLSMLGSFFGAEACSIP